MARSTITLLIVLSLKAPEVLHPGFLNPETAAAPRDASSRDLIKNLTFVNAKDKDPGTPRFALALGRLTAQHFSPDRVSQSHWACYAYGIDNDDIRLDKKGNPCHFLDKALTSQIFVNNLSDCLQGPHSAACDSAFETEREQGQKVVFLGALDDIQFKMRKELKRVKAYDLEWSTTSLSEEHNEQYQEESVVKEEIAEMKGFCTREPDFMIKGEDTNKYLEMKDIPVQSTPTKEVPDGVMDAL
ncbi:hypothetical protein N431DRAFT_446148 [Stipitochalara longipes BDJ]|nr:hypothetical protein N431DRAFT_446148 [Stipitochalara longipes BDJ]